MPVYTVERELPGIQMHQLAAAQKAAIETSQKFTAEGKDVRYIRTTFVPGEAHCMCLFEAPNADIVKEVNETAQIPFTRLGRTHRFRKPVRLEGHPPNRKTEEKHPQITQIAKIRS